VEARLDALDQGSVRTLKSRRDNVTSTSGNVGQKGNSEVIPRDDVVMSGEVLTTGELADRLTVKRNALNERLRRAGGARLGFELDGWRCVGKAKPARGGPAQWQWAPVG
jgi:hypothetical protein